jgi:arginase family enzyme
MARIAVDLAFIPGLLGNSPGRAVVVMVDVLRATSTITTLFELGARSVSLPSGLRRARALARDGRPVGAELPSGQQAPGCGLPVSPSLLTGQAVAERDVVLSGVRAMEPAEEERLAASEVSVVGANRIGLERPSVLEAALDDLKGRVGRVYVHLDLDVLDPDKAGKANEFAPEGGLSAEDLKTALGMVQKRFAVAAAGIASYDPAFDADGRVLAVALACARMLTAPAKPAV